MDEHSMEAHLDFWPPRHVWASSGLQIKGEIKPLETFDLNQTALRIT